MKGKVYTASAGAILCILIFILRTASLVYAAAPTVTTNNVDQLTSIGVRFQGTANPNSISTTGYFRYWTTNPGSCSDVGGTRVPSAGGTALGAGSSNVNYAITTASQGINLTPNTTYYYCAIASNGSIGNGTLKYFITQSGQTNGCDAPIDSSVNITSGSCSFPGSGNVTGMDGSSLTINTGATLTVLAGQTFAFQSIFKSGAYINKFSTGTLRKGYVWVKDVDADGFYDSSTATVSASASTPPGAGYVRRNTFPVEYLSQAADCNDADNTKFRQLNLYTDTDGDGYGAGSSSQQCTGQDLPGGYSTNNTDCNNSYSGATTDCSPQSVSNTSSSSITSTTATLAGSANTAGFTGTGYFKWSTTNGACSAHSNTTSTSALSALTTGQAFSQGISGLSGNTTYYWCTASDNSQAGSPKYAASNSSFVSAPNAPTGLSLSGVTTSNVTLSWTAPSGGAGGYKIYRCSGASCSPTSFIANDSDNASPYNDTSVSCGTTYGFQVSGTTGSGGAGNEGAKSSSIQYATTGACCTTGFKDYDGDGYGAGSSSCWSSGAGYTVVASGGDCYDYDGANSTIRTQSALAKPGQTNYYTVVRGTASGVNDWAGNSYNTYDYNCVSGQETNVTALGLWSDYPGSITCKTGSDLGSYNGTLYGANNPNQGSCPLGSSSYNGRTCSNVKGTNAACGEYYATGTSATGWWHISATCSGSSFKKVTGTVGCR